MKPLGVSEEEHSFSLGHGRLRAILAGLSCSTNQSSPTPGETSMVQSEE